MTNEEFNENMRKRTKALAIRILKFCSALANALALKVITWQLCKSSTSVAANFRAFCRGRSRRERYAKICIVVEEADETEFWLEMIRDTQLDNSEELHYLLAESEEILKITAKIKSGHEGS